MTLLSPSFRQAAFAGVAAVSLLIPSSVTIAAGRLVKASGPSVYYVSEDGKRYAFPNERTFRSWYENFSGVTKVSDAELTRYPLSGNVTYRPGVRLVKITTDPRVYAVTRGGILRWIKTEQVARALYGSLWNKQIDDVPDAFFTNYVIGSPIDTDRDYSPSNERRDTPTISENRRSATQTSNSGNGSSSGGSSSAGAAPQVGGSVDTVAYPGGVRSIRVSTEAAIRDAMSNVRPGDVIMIAAGSYEFSQQWWVSAKGTAAHPIYIVSEGGRGAAKIRVPSDEGINVGGGSMYVVFEGLEVSNTGNNVFHVQDGSNHITLKNLNLHDAGSDGDVLKINQAHNITVEGCDLARPGRRLADSENGWQEAIDLVDSDNSVIRRNFIHDFGNIGGIVKGGSHNTTIEENVIDRQRSGDDGEPSFGIGGWTDSSLLAGERYESVGATFRRNVIAHASYGALALYDAQNTTIEKNAFVNNSAVLIQSRAGNAPEQASSVVRITGNRFVDTRGSMPRVCEVHSHGLNGVTATGNQYWNNGSAIPSGSECGFTPGQESGATVSDPGIVDSNPSSYEQAMRLLEWLPS